MSCSRFRSRLLLSSVTSILLVTFASAGLAADDDDGERPNAGRKILQPLLDTDGNPWAPEFIVRPDAPRLLRPESIVLSLDVDFGMIDLYLEPHTVRQPGFTIWVDVGGGKVQPVDEPAPCRAYRGEVVGAGGGTVVASVDADGRLYATLSIPSGRWHIEPMSELFADGVPGEHAMFSARNRPAGEGWTCGVDSSVGLGPIEGSQRDDSEPQIQFGLAPLVSTIAFDTDWEYFGDNNQSVSQTVFDLEANLNVVSAEFEQNVGLTYKTQAIIVRTSSNDPYSTHDADGMLGELKAEWDSNQTHISRDVVHMMTGKNFIGPTLGIAWLDAACTGFGYGITENWNTFANRAVVTTHELGHNWGSDHDTDCGGAGGSCQLMCPTADSGCNGNITWSNQTKNAISAYMANSSCLDFLDGGNTIYVNHANQFTPTDGSKDNAFKTVGEALFYCCGFDASVAAGTYAEAPVVWASGVTAAPMTLVATGGSVEIK